MALLTVEGVYKNGRIELKEMPTEVPSDARVLVTFLPGAGGGEARDEAQARHVARREAADRLLSRLHQGIDFGGPPYPSREELYDRINRFSQGDG